MCAIPTNIGDLNKSETYLRYKIQESMNFNSEPVKNGF